MENKRGKVVLIDDEPMQFILTKKIVEDFIGADFQGIEYSKSAASQVPVDTDIFLIDGLDGNWKGVMQELVNAGFTVDQIVLFTAGDRPSNIKEAGIQFVSKHDFDGLIAIATNVLRKRGRLAE